MSFNSSELIITKAEMREYEAVRAFYFDVIDGFEGQEFRPGWQKDVYPAPEELSSLIGKGELYVGKEDGEIVSVMAFNHDSNEGYAQVRWPTEAAPDEVFVLHMLGVRPSRWRSGIAREMVRYAVSLAKAQGGKVIRLDVLKGNIPANRLYEAAGFGMVDTLTMYYPDTGYTDFELYELAL